LHSGDPKVIDICVVHAGQGVPASNVLSLINCVPEGVHDGVAVEVAVRPPVIVKLTSFMSKKMLPTPSTFILAAAVGRLGTLIDSEPSFGVEASIVVGNVCPPSVESEILTLAVFMPPAVVPLTSHVTVWPVFPVQFEGVFCVVTLKGVVVLAISFGSETVCSA
jgi:hypothetical protein